MSFKRKSFEEVISHFFERNQAKAEYFIKNSYKKMNLHLITRIFDDLPEMLDAGYFTQLLEDYIDILLKANLRPDEDGLTTLDIYSRARRRQWEIGLINTAITDLLTDKCELKNPLFDLFHWQKNKDFINQNINSVICAYIGSVHQAIACHIGEKVKCDAEYAHAYFNFNRFCQQHRRTWIEDQLILHGSVLYQIQKTFSEPEDIDNEYVFVPDYPKLPSRPYFGFSIFNLWREIQPEQKSSTKEYKP